MLICQPVQPSRTYDMKLFIDLGMPDTAASDICMPLDVTLSFKLVIVEGIQVLKL